MILIVDYTADGAHISVAYEFSAQSVVSRDHDAPESKTRYVRRYIPGTRYQVRLA